MEEETLLKNGEAMAEESSSVSTRNSDLGASSGSTMERNSSQTERDKQKPKNRKDPAAPVSDTVERKAAVKKESKTESKVRQNGRTGSSDKEEQLPPEQHDGSVKKQKKPRKKKKMKARIGEEEEEDKQQGNILEFKHKENIMNSKIYYSKNIAKGTHKENSPECKQTEHSPESKQKENSPESKQKENMADAGGQTPKKKNKTVEEKSVFPAYIPEEEVERLLDDPNVTDEEYVKGYLHINPRFVKHAYVDIPDWDKDLLIISVTDRNRALEGDLVVARVNPPNQWKRSKDTEQKTGTVVCILDKVHPRLGIGSLKQFKSRVVFYPRDARLPLLTIFPRSIPRMISLLPDLYDNALCIADILTWKKPTFAIGQVKRVLGSTGDIEAESQAILMENNLDVTPYKKHMLVGLPNSDYVLTEDDLKDREDWRDECIFTIDPVTATDLDDAVSCKLLENGNYEVGVHIADVTHFLQFLSPLDMEVAKRATTVYTTDNVYHMLPNQLCQVCSLLPGQDKLAFSVIWEITPNAEILNHRFAKTVIRSCTQMSYQQAQTFIEKPREEWPDDLLSVVGPFTTEKLSDVVLSLYRLSVQLRSKRFSNGALRIDQLKLHVTLDRSTGLPVSYTIEEHADSNRLIEEFMLLANMTVATQLYRTIPETALLRNHRSPSPRLLTEMKSTLETFGIHLEIESAQSLQASIERYEIGLNSECEEFRTITKYRMLVINYLCAKAMQRATYRCASALSEEELRHYALNVPLYTHFTSPIRRYADCVVHRLLYSSIMNVPLPDTWTEKLCAKIASNCNVKKYSAKLAQESSTKLYFAYLVGLMGSFDAVAIVTDVKGKTVESILCDLGIKVKVNLATIESSAKIQGSTESSVPSATISWKDPVVTQVVTLFSLIRVRVEPDTESNELNATILLPEQS